MRVLVGCEFSGIVRKAFADQGHDAWSVDLLPTEIPGNHYQCDLFDVIDKDWDMGLFFPPCTYIASSGNRWYTGTQERIRALNFVIRIMNTEIPRMAIENPVGAINSMVDKPDQIIQPWEFGHGETKATCLWLYDLPFLYPTKIAQERFTRVHRESPGVDRWKRRSRTYPGIAKAMAEQWGNLPAL